MVEMAGGMRGGAEEDVERMLMRLGETEKLKTE
jgi:hypothetical protein